TIGETRWIFSARPWAPSRAGTSVDRRPSALVTTTDARGTRIPGAQFRNPAGASQHRAYFAITSLQIAADRAWLYFSLLTARVRSRFRHSRPRAGREESRVCHHSAPDDART